MRSVVGSEGFWEQEPRGLSPIVFAGKGVRYAVMVESWVVAWGWVYG